MLFALKLSDRRRLKVNIVFSYFTNSESKVFLWYELGVLKRSDDYEKTTYCVSDYDDGHHCDGFSS